MFILKFMIPRIPRALVWCSIHVTHTRAYANTRTPARAHSRTDALAHPDARARAHSKIQPRMVFHKFEMKGDTNTHPNAHVHAPVLAHAHSPSMGHGAQGSLFLY